MNRKILILIIITVAGVSICLNGKYSYAQVSTNTASVEFEVLGNSNIAFIEQAEGGRRALTLTLTGVGVMNSVSYDDIRVQYKYIYPAVSNKSDLINENLFKRAIKMCHRNSMVKIINQAKYKLFNKIDMATIEDSGNSVEVIYNFHTNASFTCGLTTGEGIMSWS